MVSHFLNGNKKMGGATAPPSGGHAALAQNDLVIRRLFAASETGMDELLVLWALGQRMKDSTL